MSTDGNSQSKPPFGIQHRLNRRQRAHRDAASEPLPAAAIPDHPHVAAADAEYLVEQSQLEEFLQHARRMGLVAYDTEFIGELSYHPQLCLIQLATTRRVAVLDAMVDIDLAPIWNLLADPAVVKVVHAGSQDLEPVVRHLDQRPMEVFDTQIGAGLTGLPYPLALLKLVQETIGVRLGKALTFTSWDHRPLSKAHLRYAADDVRYLPAVYQALIPRLKQMEHYDWARQECDALCEPGLYKFDPRVQAGRVRGAKGLGGRDLGLLLELVTLRDRGARLHNLPPRAFIKDEVLLDIVRRPPKTAQQLAAIRGLPRPVEQQYGQEILETVQRVTALPKSHWPKSREIEETATERFQIDSLWSAVQTYCMGRGVDPALVATRAEVADHFRALQAGKLSDQQALHTGWRGQFIGQFIADFLRGDTHLNLHWRMERLDVLKMRNGE